MKRIIILILALILTLAACSEDKAAESETTAELVAGDNGEGIFSYETEYLTYDFYYNDDPRHITITGVINENVFEYEIPVKIDGVNVTEIGEYAFIYAQLNNLTLHNGLNRIAKGAFYNCASLAEVKIPSTVKYIGDYAYYYCQLLERVEIPDTLTYIGGLAFYGTPWLDSLTDEFVIMGDGILLDYNGEGGAIKIPDGVKFISSAFYGIDSITSVQIPDSCTVIGAAAFMNAINLKDVNIPDSVTEIGDSAFAGCTALTKPDIPDSVTKIGIAAFE